MAIYVRCPACERLAPHDRPKCLCGVSIPLSGRNYWIAARRNGKKFKRAVGKVSLEYARKIERELTRGGRDHEIFTWKEVRYAYLKKLELERKSEGYQKDVARYLAEMGAFWGEDLRTDRLDSRSTQAFILSLLERKRPPKPATVNRYIAAGRGACNYSDIRPNPFRRIKQQKEIERTAYLTDAQRTRLLECALQISCEVWEILMVAIHTGLRKSEVLNLQWSEIDLTNGLIQCRQKGGSIRPVFLDSVIQCVLSNIPKTSEWVWPGRFGRPHRKDWRGWEKARDLADIPPSFTFHDLRHDFGTRVYLATGDIRAAKELLAHSQMTTTLRYAHALPEHLRKIIELVGGGSCPLNPE